MTYLITRPQPEADRTRRALDMMRLTSHVCPLLTFEKLEFMLPKPSEIAGTIVTSTSALRALSDEQIKPLVNLPVHCVGRYTAINARKANFRHVDFTVGNAEDLMERLLQTPVTKPYLYLTGVDRKSTIEDMCAQHSVKLFLCETYKMLPREQISFFTLSQFKKGVFTHGLIYSERTAHILIDRLTAYGLMDYARTMRWFSLSQPIADVLTKSGLHGTWAAEPSHESLMELVQSEKERESKELIAQPA